MPKIPKEVREHMARMGAKGGKATGQRKARPASHYAAMVKARKRKARLP